MINFKKIIILVVLIYFSAIFPLKTEGALLKGGSNFDTAVELTPGNYEGEEIRGGEREYFFVNLKAGQSLQIEMNLSSRGGGIGGIVLYDENKLTLFKKEELVQREPATFKILYLLNSEKDSYKIYIKKYCRLLKFEKFSINLAINDFYDISSQTDASEGFEGAMNISFGKYQGYLSGGNGNDKKDFYKISVKENGNLMIVVKPLTETARISTVIYDSEKKVIAEKVGNSGKEIRASRYITKPGDYFVEIKGNAPEIISYEFELLAGGEPEEKIGKKSFFEIVNLKFIFGIIFLILIIFVAGKIIYSVWKK